MRAATHTRTWLLAIACLVVFASCRRVTIISFHADSPTLAIDTLTVNLQGTGKRSVRLDGMDQQLGLYNLPDDSITISAFGCAWNSDSTALYVTAISVLSGHLGSNPYSIVSDAVTVEMTAFTDDSQTPCPMVEPDGSVTGEPSGAGGAAGGGNGSSGAGGAGVGGMTVVGDAGRDGGIDAAGGAGGIDAGAGGNTGEGGCDDGGQHDTGVGVDAQICSPPPDPPEMRTVAAASQACVDYCNRIVGSSDGGAPLCQGIYDSVDQCFNYCTLAAWAPGSANDSADTMGCRIDALAKAEQNTPQSNARAIYCAAAGPSGGAGAMTCGANIPHGTCPTFCNAWANICPGHDAGACLTACQSAPVTEPSCRFPWLLRATSDERYCDSLDYTGAGACLPPGC